MQAAGYHVEVLWRRGAPTDARLRARVLQEVRALAPSLARVEGLLHEAHQATEYDHPFLAPRIELRLPLYELGARWRLVFTLLDAARIHLVDEAGEKMAEVRLL